MHRTDTELFLEVEIKFAIIPSLRERISASAVRMAIGWYLDCPRFFRVKVTPVDQEMVGEDIKFHPTNGHFEEASCFIRAVPDEPFIAPVTVRSIRHFPGKHQTYHTALLLKIV